jgi:hypothetical protein
MTDFLHEPGTSGFIVTPFQLFTSADTGLNALASGAAVTSAHGGGTTNGIFRQTDFGSGQYAEIWFSIVTAGWTPTAGGCISGWWLLSSDGGTTFEAVVAAPSTTVPALPGPPDFVIPLEAAALSAGILKFARPHPVPLPYSAAKCVIQNNTGAAFGAGAHTITCGPVADRFV